MKKINIMKKKLPNKGVRSLFKVLGTLLFTLILIPQNLAAQESMSDQDQIITKCLTHKELEAKIPEGVKSQMTEYYILDYGVEFNFSPSLKINGKNTSLISKEEVNLNKPYFQFNKFDIVSNRALVEYNFVYITNGKENILSITIEFGKTNSKWSEYNHYISN
jgi:hypothetical protein